LRFGGIIVESEERRDMKGNPCGRYTLEDYSGSYTFSLYDEAYIKYAPLLKQNVYVFITGLIQQFGAGKKWFNPKPIHEASYTLAISQVDFMRDAHKYVQQITLDIPIQNIQPSLIDDLVNLSEENKGDMRLQLRIFDEIKQNVITFNAAPIKMNQAFYHWIKMQELDEVLTHTVQ
jgi:DNA polymerase-3 subunit alpha